MTNKASEISEKRVLFDKFINSNFDLLSSQEVVLKALEFEKFIYNN